MKKILILITILASIIAGYFYWEFNLSPKAKLLSILKNSLNDPYSAKIGENYYFEKSGGLCGLINAKNKYGAYTGETRFIVEKSGKVTFDPQQFNSENTEDLQVLLKQAEENLEFAKLLYAIFPDDSK